MCLYTRLTEFLLNRCCLLQLLLFLTLSSCKLYQLFNRALQHRSSKYNSSLHTQCVFTQDWLNSFWILIVASSCLLYHMVSSLMNSLERGWLCLHKISIIVNKSLEVLVFTVVFIRYLLYCILLLLVYFLIPLFFTEVFAIFLFIHLIFKQTHYFGIWSFCLSF